MSDPIFQKKRLADAAFRAFSGFVIAPLIALLVLTTFYSLIEWSRIVAVVFSVEDFYSAWLSNVAIIAVGLVYAILWSTISTAMSWKSSSQGVILGLIGAVGSIWLAIGFFLYGATYYTILPSALFLLIIGFEAARISFVRISPYLSLETLRFRRAVLEEA